VAALYDAIILQKQSSVILLLMLFVAAVAQMCSTTSQRLMHNAQSMLLSFTYSHIYSHAKRTSGVMSCGSEVLHVSSACALELL
jgi:hypothetical protein